jgi:hypothetical protein
MFCRTDIVAVGRYIAMMVLAEGKVGKYLLFTKAKCNWPVKCNFERFPIPKTFHHLSVSNGI